MMLAENKGLGDGVVGLAGQMLALLQGGGLLRLLVEARVLDGHRCLIGDRPHEPRVVLRVGGWL